ncbi:MAG: hypothetical protein NZM37_11905, partial [Sandaracinaceae bacterium]|nr:hypothetical protein [Sandaracinaceae bacterium]
MAYSGASVVRASRESLSRVLALLQEPSVPSELQSLTEVVAQAVGKLFEAEQASEEREGKTATRAAMGFISQALALLQEAPNPREEVQQSIEILATAMSSIYPLTTAPTLAPPPPEPAQKEPEGQALAPTVKLAPSEVPS